MPSAKPISKTQSGFPEYLDFRHLREEGIRHIQKLSGDVWTDHNLHDPGITILEVLCYALLDLGYRANLPINELLAQDHSKKPSNEQFFTAAEILSNNPLTVLDYRKLLIDIRGVRNAWLVPSEESEVVLELNCDATGDENQLIYAKIQPNFTKKIQNRNKQVVLNGLWKVLLELDPVNPESQNNARCKNDDASVARILDDVNACLHQHRNLCEDFFEICVLQDEQIGVCAHLEIASTADPEDVLVDLFERLRDFLSPAVQFHTLENMLEMGKTMEEIFAGRPYRLDNKGILESHGFIDTGELEKLERKTDIHASDLLREIMDTPGIKAVSKLMLYNYIGNQAQTTGMEWCLKLTPGYRPILAPELSKITLFKDGIPFTVNLQEVIARYTVRLSNAQKVRLRPYELDKAIPDGKFHATIGEHHSIQHDFPSVYGIGEGGIPDSASMQRKAQAMQLKGYLLFFDQLLANYLAQLAHLRDFFALRPEKKGVLSTFYPGSIQSVPDLNQLIRSAAPDDKGESLTGGTALYKKKELIAIPCAIGTHEGADDYLLLDSPKQRDNLIRTAISSFENEEAIVGAQLDVDCQLYRFTLTLPIDLPGGNTGLLLRSASLFESEEEAMLEGESLTFLGLGEEHYRLINRDQLQEYTFELFYNPRNYNSILTDLAESPGEARSRRSRFLDHLLARFAEDFSEYALLQFKTGSQRAELENRVIAAKENFLADYPDISRNRGKGFDFTDREYLWNTENVTGLERRVSRLMGIDDWQRRTLSPFDVVIKPLSQYLTLKDFRGRVIFESIKKYYNPVIDWPEFSVKIKALAADPANYRPIDCDSQGMFGFQLVETLADGSECVIACHPDTYCCAEDRDAKMAYIAELFQGDIACPPDDGLGCCGKIRASRAGFYFLLAVAYTLPKIDKKKTETIQIYVKGAEVFPEKKDALVAWVALQGQAKIWSDYTLAAQPFSQNVMPQIVDQNRNPLALLAKFPSEESKASQALTDVFDYFSKFEASGQLFQNPGGWTWHLSDGQGEALLESLYYFETREQALKALDHALELAALPDNLSKEKHADGAFGYQLLEQYPEEEDQKAYSVPVAQSPAAATWDETQCHVSLQKTVKIAEKESSFFRRMIVKSTALRLTVNNSEGTMLLQGGDVFVDLPAAEAAWVSLLESARKPENYNFEKEAGITVQLLDSDGRALAESPSVFYTQEDALAFRGQVVQAALSDQLKMDTERTGKVFNFQLTDADNNPLLLGSTWLLDKEAAQTGYYDALYWAKQAQYLISVGDKTGSALRIELRNEIGKVLAVSQESFEEVSIRDGHLATWRAWFGGQGIPSQVVEKQGSWNFFFSMEDAPVLIGAGEFPSKAEAALAFEMALQWACQHPAYQCFKASDGCRFSFELLDMDKKEVLATHPDWYETEAACEKAVARLVAFLEKNKLPYEIAEKKTPTWQYEVCWESCDERIESVLVGQNAYDTEEEAKAAFCAMLKWIKGLKEEEAKCQMLDDGTYGFALMVGDDTAIHPRSYTTPELCACVINDLILYAKKTNWMVAPTFPTTAGSCFRLLKGEWPSAIFGPKFLKTELRDEAWDALLEKTTCGPPEYSVIDLSSCAIEVKNGKYYFQLMCGNTVWWRSCAEFGSSKEAMDAFAAQYLAIIALASDPDNYQSHCAGDEFCYFWLPDPSDPECKRCIVRTEKLPPGADLKAAYTERLKWARTYPIFENEDCTYSFKIVDPETGDPIWLSAKSYPTVTEAQHAFEHFIALLCFEENYQKTDDWQGCAFGIELTEAGLVQANPCPLAPSPSFKSSPYFSDIVLGEGAVREKAMDFYFEIKSCDGVWWRSLDTSSTREEAHNKLQNLYFPIVEASAISENFVSVEDTDRNGWFLQLELLSHPLSEVRTAFFQTEKELSELQERIRHWAGRFPIFRTPDDQYKFRIFHPGTDTVSWVSENAYGSVNEAELAFEHFINLFDFKEYYKVGNTAPLPKGGGLQTQMVNIGPIPKPLTDDEIKELDPKCSWNELETCLANLDAPSGGSYLFIRFMPKKDCRWGLIWAEDAYRVARAPQVYHTPQARECAREALFHAILCSCLLKEDCEDKWYFKTLEKCCKVFYDCKTLKLPWRGGFGLLQFEKGDECCEIKEDKEFFIRLESIVDLMALARAEECYVAVQDNNPSSGLTTLGLMDRQNNLVAIGAYLVKPEDLEACKQDAIRLAWEFPIVRRGDKFGFQLALEQEILLENAIDFKNPFEALKAFCEFVTLLGQKSNYVGVEPDDCGPFGIEIVDATKIKALHPATYPCRADAEKAVETIRHCLEAEGFHVIEHILLRPKTPGIPLENRWQICVNGQPIFIAANPADDVTDAGKAAFLEQFLISLKKFVLQLDPTNGWSGEQPVELTDPKNEVFALSAYPVLYDCLDEFLLVLNDLDAIEPCLVATETIGDILFEACADPDDCRNPELSSDCIPGADPYSFWATVAIPWWGSRFRNLDFRHFVEKTLRREAPAHVGLRIGWLGAQQMTELEARYRNWLENNALGDDSCARQEALNALMETMKNLVNVYPSGKLHDCDSGEDGGAIMQLDKTTLGPD